MKKIVRLTEADLVRIVKRVIKEDPNDIASQIVECASQVLTLTDLTKIPTCVELGTTVISTKKIPTDATMKIMSCGSELMKLNKTPQDGIKFLNCVLTKISTSPPVMNERRSRRL